MECSPIDVTNQRHIKTPPWYQLIFWCSLSWAVPPWHIQKSVGRAVPSLHAAKGYCTIGRLVCKVREEMIDSAGGSLNEMSFLRPNGLRDKGYNIRFRRGKRLRNGLDEFSRREVRCLWCLIHRVISKRFLDSAGCNARMLGNIMKIGIKSRWTAKWRSMCGLLLKWKCLKRNRCEPNDIRSFDAD